MGEDLVIPLRGRQKSLLAYFVISLSACFSADLTPLSAQDQPSKEIYQDFRNKRPLPDSLRFAGPDIDGEFKAETEGLRVTLPPVREHYWPAEVMLNFPLTGDFEMTGTYEFLAGAQPTKGYGLGVSLLICDTDKRKKFAKVCRVLRAKEGSVHLTEFWSPYQVHSTQTEAKAGQLRLTRVGPSLRYLVSDGPGQSFREIWYQENFGAEDMLLAAFGVADSGEPGNPVDARLIDLRVRIGAILPEKALDPAPIAASAPASDSPPAAVETGKIASKGWLTALLVLGLGLTFALAILGVATWFFIRNRRRSQLPPPQGDGIQPESKSTPATMIISCSNCGKKLKVRTALTGKKVKCTQCGTAIIVPETAE